MTKSDLPDQIPLFDDDSVPEPVQSLRPWRATPADRWSAEDPPSTSAMEQAALDLLRRNLEFLRAMDLHAGKVAAMEVRRFEERHEDLIRGLVRWRVDGDKESARAALAALGDLADLRLRALERLDPERLRKVMAAESRVGVRDFDIERALSMAEFELAEARGELIEIEIPAPPDSFDSSGLLGPSMVENLVRAQMDAMKAEQEWRPLPPREGLGPLLRDLPVVWLDAIWQALGLGPDRPRRRKERERTIARHLAAEGIVAEVVGERLSMQERRLLAFLLQRGGKAPAADVARRFGNDGSDGWFWNEEPPTSVLGQVRLHGLAFVGVSDGAPGTRTVLVPQELREGLEDALALAGTGTEEGEHRKERAAPGLRPELVEALNAAFPDGIVKPVWDESILEAMEGDLRSQLAGLEGASLLYQRTLEGDETWDLPEGFALEDPGEGEEWEEEGGWYDQERSYTVFFLSPRGEGFQYQIEGDFMDEAGHLDATTGVGRIGLAVAVSGLAPFALLRVTSIESEEPLGTLSPDIQSRLFDADGIPVKEDEVYLDMLEPEERGLMGDLRREVARILESLRITVLPEEEVGQAVPWLYAAEGVFLGLQEGASLTVEDVLFFHHLY